MKNLYQRSYRALPLLLAASLLEPAGATGAPHRMAPEAVREAAREALHPTDQPGAAQAFFLRKRSPDGRPIDMARYQAALAQMQGMPRYSSGLDRFLPSRSEAGSASVDKSTQAALTGLWAPLGPGNIGGRIRRLVIHPTRPQTMWAAAVAGGIWKTLNGGASWLPTGDFLPNLAFSSLALAPNNPAVLYAGSGEGFFNGDAVRGAGIFKSTNGGTTWLQLPATKNADFNFVNDLAVSKGNPNRVYAATRTGVWRSLDAGATWARVLNPATIAGCTDLALRTDQTSDYLFAACGSLQPPAGIWRNKNAQGVGGWTKVKTEANMGRTSLAIAPSNQNIVYALSSSIQSGDFQDGLLAVFRSDNGGTTWTAKVRNTTSDSNSRLLLTNPVIASFVECTGEGQNQFFNQGWYDNVIAVDPKDPNRVFTGGIDVFVSTNGGSNFDPISFWWAGGPPAAHAFAHADQHDIVFSPLYNGTTNKTMFLANDGGIWKTVNARANPSQTVCDPDQSAFTFTNLNHGLEATQFYDGVAYPGGATYFGGAQDNGTTRGTDAAGRNSWTSILGGDGGSVAVDPGNTNVLFAENTGISIQKSIDGGANFTLATDGINDSGALFIAPFEMDPSDSQRLWTGGSRIWRTADGATNWVAASTALAGAGDAVSAIGIAPSSPNAVLVGSSAGDILRNANALSATGSTHWLSAKPRDGYVAALAFDPNDAQVAYAGYATFTGVHVWKTIDGGAHWTPRDGSGAGVLPDVPVDAIAVDPANSSHLFLGTDLGVFVSVDGGATWAIEATGFPNVVTDAIQIQGDALFAFTHGRGAWRTAITH